LHQRAIILDASDCCEAFRVVPSDAEIIERLLRFDDCISARRIMSYDVRVYELVEHFLSGVPEKNTERNRRLLAQHIQDELEDWVLFMLLPGKDVHPADGL
jgi:hypothetical protein